MFGVYSRKLKIITNTGHFLEDIRDAAERYVKIHKPTEDKLYLQSLRAMNITKCYPLLLRAKEILTDKNFDAISKAIECISFRHSIIKCDPKDLEKMYYNLLNKLNSDNDVDAVIEEIKEHVTMKNEGKFKSEFENAFPKSNISKMILDRIVRHQSESVNWKSKDVHLEHIMPQRPKGKWLELKNYDSELYGWCLPMLGNLTLLKDKLNQSASNKDFSTKKNEYYKDSRLKITRDLMEYDEWDFQSITERQEKLYEIAKEIWRL